MENIESESDNELSFEILENWKTRLAEDQGFIASGPPNPDRPPQPIFPLGLGVEPQEGFGEVQTPLIVPRSKRGQIKLGDPIFFRPAKAGEIAERFTEYCLLSQDRIVNQVPTYRGMNQCFH